MHSVKHYYEHCQFMCTLSEVHPDTPLTKLDLNLSWSNSLKRAWDDWITASVCYAINDQKSDFRSCLCCSWRCCYTYTITFSYGFNLGDNKKNTPAKCWIMTQNVPANSSTPANTKWLLRNASKSNEELWLHVQKAKWNNSVAKFALMTHAAKCIITTP